MPDSTSIEFQQTAKKILESTNIYYFQNLFGLSNSSTYPSEEMFQAAVSAGLRRLALCFHPDKNPKMKLLAEEVMKKLGNVSRHFIGGEALYENTNLRHAAFESNIQLLDRIEALLDPQKQSRLLPEVRHTLPELIEEAKKRVQRDKKFMEVETSSRKRLLYLAACWDNNLFLWLCEQGDDPLWSTHHLSPIHVLVKWLKQDTLIRLCHIMVPKGLKKFA